MILVRYREALAGRVLELGCGAGRVTGYLAELATSVEALDISPAMVAACRSAYPSVSVAVRDMRDLSPYETASFDAVVAAFNALDYVGHEERLELLRQIRRVLRPHGLLSMSSHNRWMLASVPTPFSCAIADRRPIGIARGLVHLPRWITNRSRLRVLERAEAEYAVAVDQAHGFRLLHYYIDRDAQERQLRECGFELLECLDLNGQLVLAGETAAHDAELHYLARALPEAPSGTVLGQVTATAGRPRT